ncbi:basic helix-loop-helix (bHLH) DNA-binding family protein [Striga asiatica]|uniref:Basic helix-loop-helix (BHLH) DNA-binding family protein n=1 Tax=Striga asiatica TaxID=4170 RepID=A0A5A7R267_STRAF|nr:basic helix-loop-helix (bHLH) DNA-binding family protein [Striga asiatica]
MDTIFLLGDEDRAAFLQQMMQSFGCIHICLWSYLSHPSNCLLAMDGLYRDSSNLQQPSSSSATLARRLFDAYRESVNYVETENMRIPGFAFKNNLPYMELKLPDLQRMASHDVQLQFYQEAGIKTVVFMGCSAGEIELGMSNDPQVDMGNEMKNLFPADFSRQAARSAGGEMPTHLPSSASSSTSLRSLSADSSEYYSPLLLNKIHHNQEPLITPLIIHRNPGTAFTRYSDNPARPGGYNISAKQNMFKRAILFFRNLNMRKRNELQAIQGRPTTAQMHHMISERRRREKLNESFQVLRSLLPSGTKKDKASVLSSTTEYLNTLKSRVDELSRRNQMLESQILSVQRLSKGSGGYVDDETGPRFCSVDERVNVEITQVSSPSTSEARFLDLRVIVRVRLSGEIISDDLSNLVIAVLEFLKKQRNVSLYSLKSNTRMSGQTAVHEMMSRLKIEGDEFDESGFQEAVRRVVDT